MHRRNKIKNYDFIDTKCRVLEAMFQREQEKHLHYKLQYHKVLLEIEKYKEIINNLLLKKDRKRGKTQ